MKWVLVLVVLGGIAYGIYALVTSEPAQETAEVMLGSDALEQKDTTEKNLAIAAANDLYRIKKLEGVDFSSGPCLSNSIIPGWVLDIAHNPRLEIDDLPENQCATYREGTASHFVELDPEGNLIRAQ